MMMMLREKVKIMWCVLSLFYELAVVSVCVHGQQIEKKKMKKVKKKALKGNVVVVDFTNETSDDDEQTSKIDRVKKETAGGGVEDEVCVFVCLFGEVFKKNKGLE